MAMTEPEFNGSPRAVGGVTFHTMRSAAALAIPRTPLVGRRQEIAAVCALFTESDARLVTLTGPGGVGKTRLAFAVMNELNGSFAGDVWFVPLAPVRDPALVLASVAQVLDIWESGTQPLVDQLIGVLAPRRCLLVLDNFEQVIDAAPLVSTLLRACPELRILTTSRETLRIAGEHLFAVSPLPLPAADSVDAIASSDAIRLFVDRARAVRSDFTPDLEALTAISAICKQLDGLPLAIELAAARTVILTPRQLQARLRHRLPLLTGGARDSPTRLQTMRGAIAWSCDLMSPTEQRLFRRLSVFAGGFTLHAAEEVNRALDGADVAPPVLDDLASVTAKSLVGQEAAPDGTARFRMLEVIREYAAEQLDRSGETEAAQRAHATFFAQLALRADAAFWCAAPGDWRAMLEPELDNLRQALTWLLDHGETDLALSMATALYALWLYHGLESEGASWLRRALVQDGGDPALRARALEVAGLLAIRQGDYTFAMSCVERGRAFADQARDVDAQARIAYLYGCFATNVGDETTARTYLEDALHTFESLGDRGRAAGALCELAILGTLQGDPSSINPVALTRSERNCQRGLAIFRELGHSVGIARALHGLGYLAYKRGNLAEALAYVQESLRQRIELREIWGINANLEDVADIAAHSGQPVVAARLYGAAEALRAFYGTALGLRYREEYEAEVAVARRALPAEEFAAAWNAGQALTLDEAIADALAFTLRSARPPENDYRLSRREMDVLRLLAQGQSDRQIARTLSISPRTVNHHVMGILTKLDVDNRTAATFLAVRAGLVEGAPHLRKTK